MLWHALPPEVNTALLMAGAGPEPMLQAATGWESLATALDTQAVELAGLAVSLQQAWTGPSSERAAAAIEPALAWLHNASQTAQRRGIQAAAQAASYARALGTTPSLPEIAVNHITHAVLSATNFLGINMVPIGMNEVDYFGRMWNQAGTAMDAYQAETVANTMFEPIEPMRPILAPGAEAAEAAASVRTSAAGSRSSADGDDPPQPTPDDGGSLGDQILKYLAGAALLSAPLQQMTQQMMQPLQQIASLAGHGGGAAGLGGQGVAALAKLPGPDSGHVGLVGAHPFSSHPLAGGSGPRVGKGLMYASALPGAGGSASGTALLTGLVDKPGPAGIGTSSAGAGASAAGGAAPVGALGAGAHAGAGTRSGLTGTAAPARADDDGAEFDDEDDW